MKLKKNEILVLRNVREDMTSYNGFVWPEKGHVIAHDWKDNYKCGNGLHGLPWGVGNISFLYTEPCKWLVLRVDVIKDYNHGKEDMTDKCKFHECDVVFCGTREDAVALILKHIPIGLPINYATQTAGDVATQTAGYGSTQTAGYGSTQKAGDRSTQTAGYRSTQTAGDGSTQTAGDGSTQKAGINTVQIIHYCNDDWKVKTRVITEDEANKWYCFEDEDWRLLTQEEIEKIKQ